MGTENKSRAKFSINGLLLKSNTGSLFFWGCYLYELWLSQEERNRLGLPPLTDAEKAFVSNAKKRMEEQKEAKEESKELQKTYHDDDKFIMLRVPLKIAAPGWGENFKKPVFPHVDIPKADVMESSAVKPLGELIGCKLDEEMIAFGKEHGFPVIFVICERTSKEHDGVFTNERRIQFFENNQMHYAAEFAKNNNGELGVYDPRSAEERFKDEYMQQVVMDNELSPYCKNHHCTERGPQCDKCAYTALATGMTA